MITDFRSRVALRVVFIGLCVSSLIYSLQQAQAYLAAGLLSLVVVGQLVELFHFTSITNRKLTRFLESIKYSDFISGFAYDNKLGKSFKGLNAAFNDVLEAFRKARSEKEENWQYLNTVVQQVRTGIVSFDESGNVQLINANARRFMGVSSITNIEEVRSLDSNLFDALNNVQPGKSILHRVGNEYLLTIQATELKIRSSTVKLITLQNIQTELQRQELEAWQNLTRVLRHEIMNSITPISSLTSTLREVLDHDMIARNSHFELKNDSAEDLREGLNTIENRSKGLIKFIDAYREYTSLPQPRMQFIKIKKLFENVVQLMRSEVRGSHIHLSTSIEPADITLLADEEMIQQVLINLLKNSIESFSTREDAKVELSAKMLDTGVVIEVIDNGPGIIQEALDKIFVPFFTTKKTGSGIGLALSRQILQLHNGTISVKSTPYKRTVFKLQF